MAYAHRRDERPSAGMGGVQPADWRQRIRGESGMKTYLVERGNYECIYVNMPRFGFGAATDHVPVSGRLESARQRVGKAE